MAGYPLSSEEFKDDLAKGILTGLKCSACGEWTLPPQAVCSACGGAELTKGRVSPAGTIRSYTVIRVAPQGFKPPYLVALAELDDGPWVLGNIDGLGEGIGPEEAGMDLIGRRVQVGARFPAPHPQRAGSRPAVFVFTLLNPDIP